MILNTATPPEPSDTGTLYIKLHKYFTISVEVKLHTLKCNCIYTHTLGGTFTHSHLNTGAALKTTTRLLYIYQ